MSDKAKHKLEWTSEDGFLVAIENEDLGMLQVVAAALGAGIEANKSKSKRKQKVTLYPDTSTAASDAMAFDPKATIH